jgi:hypothetical protein
MTRDITSRQVYIRITNEKGKREYLNVGYMMKDGRVKLYKGMPLSGWFDV